MLEKSFLEMSVISMDFILFFYACCNLCPLQFSAGRGLVIHLKQTALFCGKCHSSNT